MDGILINANRAVHALQSPRADLQTFGYSRAGCQLDPGCSSPYFGRSWQAQGLTAFAGHILTHAIFENGNNNAMHSRLPQAIYGRHAVLAGTGHSSYSCFPATPNDEAPETARRCLLAGCVRKASSSC
eukprot:6178326-Pleurochrysis_carterae.AAC.2